MICIGSYGLLTSAESMNPLILLYKTTYKFSGRSAMMHSTNKTLSQKSTKSKISNSLVQIQDKSKSCFQFVPRDRFEFVLRDTEP